MVPESFRGRPGGSWDTSGFPWNKGGPGSLRSVLRSLRGISGDFRGLHGGCPRRFKRFGDVSRMSGEFMGSHERFKWSQECSRRSHGDSRGFHGVSVEFQGRFRGSQ